MCAHAIKPRDTQTSEHGGASHSTGTASRGCPLQGSRSGWGRVLCPVLGRSIHEPRPDTPPGGQPQRPRPASAHALRYIVPQCPLLCADDPPAANGKPNPPPTPIRPPTPLGHQAQEPRAARQESRGRQNGRMGPARKCRRTQTRSSASAAARGWLRDAACPATPALLSFFTQLSRDKLPWRSTGRPRRTMR